MNALKGANLGLAFLLELCALAALGWWGWQAGHSTLGKLALAVGAPGLAAVLWGLFAAPQATWDVPALRIAVKVVVFTAATLALWGVGRPALAVAFAALVLVNTALLAWLE